MGQTEDCSTGGSIHAATAAWGSISVEADGKCLSCSVVGKALGKCQFLADISQEVRKKMFDKTLC